MSDPGAIPSIEGLEGAGPRVSRISLPRRAVLRGAGTLVALPWLEAMASAGAPLDSAPPTRRLVYVYAPNGVHVDRWRADSVVEGRDKRRRRAPGVAALGDLPPLLEPLSSVRRNVLLLRGLTQDKARANGDGPGDHARAAAVYLTGVQPLKTEGQVRLGESADQRAARLVGGRTRVRSLSLGLEAGRQSGQCDSGYACAYSGHISWQSPTTPAAKESDPQRVFDRLFRGGDPGRSAEARERRANERRSVLDFVREESRRLERRLGAEDRARVDEYETGLRELERQLSFGGAAHVGEVPDSARPERGPRSFAEQADLMGALIRLAFETDVTRIATLMLGNEGSGRRYPEVGARDGHHNLSHHKGDPEKLEQIGAINRLHMEAFGRFVEGLEGARDRGGSVLDRSMVVYGSGIADGNRHDHHDLPVALVAGKKTRIRGGRVHSFERNTPLNNLHLALLERLGVEGEPLGDSTGTLSLA